MLHDNGNQMISSTCNDRRRAMLRRVEESYITPSTETEQRASQVGRFFFPSWGPFLEGPGNFTGPKSNIQIEI